jgi:hypothetical protein
VWALSLPFILIVALFRPRPYGSAVTRMLTSVDAFWRTRGWYLTR